MSVCLSVCLRVYRMALWSTPIPTSWVQHGRRLRGWIMIIGLTLLLCGHVDSKDEGTKVTPMWIAEAMVNGEVWGKGRGNTKKAAKNEAAKEGLARLGWSDVSCFLACIRHSAFVSVRC